MSDPDGLTGVEAARRLLEFGANEPIASRRFATVAQLASLFANPLVFILLIASAVSAVVGDKTDALIIVTLVGLGVGTNFWHSHRSQLAVDPPAAVGDADRHGAT